MKTKTLKLSRENHLNHMVNVVPILALAYGIQSYLFLHWNQTPQTGSILLLLGATLAMAVISLVGYDLCHQVDFHENHMTVHFNGYFKKNYLYDEIDKINFQADENTFTHLSLELYSHKKLHFYFVDNAQEIKEYIEYAKSNHFRKVA